MNSPTYTLSQPNPNIFTFQSIGKKGIVTKAVVFQYVGNGLYNLALLDREERSNSWSDKSNSNNGDLAKVMATVARIIIVFLENHPQATIYIEANSKSRNTLYHRILRNYHEIFASNLIVDASANGIIEAFHVDKDYDFFYIRKKEME
jgi:hypothetical protein